MYMKEYKLYTHHVIDADLYYVGVTSQILYDRFNNAGYRKTALGNYLNYDIPFQQNPNIETEIICDGLDKDTALDMEDILIEELKKNNKCINTNQSGLHSKNRDEVYYKRLEEWIKNYRKKYYQNNREKILIRVKKYSEEHKEERKEYNREYRERQESKEKQRERNRRYREKPETKEKERLYQQQPERKKYKNDWQKEFRKTPQGKIYGRVKHFNDRHPDKKIETPAEAKQKYLDWGYIPDYIKNDDLSNS